MTTRLLHQLFRLRLTAAWLAALTLLTSCRRGDSAAHSEIEVLCAVSLRVPVEEAARAYEAAGLGKVRLQFGGSQSMLAALEVSGKGDIFLPADLSYVSAARARNLVRETVSLAEMKAVVAVAKGNPGGISAMSDLQKDGWRVVLANPELAAISQLAKKALPPQTWETLAARAVAMKPTVNEVANDIVLGAADAGLVWDVTVLQTKGLESVAVPELAAVTGAAAGAVATASTQPAAALRFLRWLASPEKGGPVFSRHGYSVVRGDGWVETPTLTLMAGAMLRPAVEPALVAFEQREGCRVERVYNGCGILVGQMKAATPGDVFFACDSSFMRRMTDVFPDPVDISTNRLVILVPRGNPRGLRTLQDLGQPGLRLGIGHDKQCSLGVITQTTLAQSGWREAVMQNVAVQSPTGDLLVNQLLAGGLDAALTYVSNAAGSADKLEALAVGLDCATASQSLGIAKGTKFPQLAARLREALRSADSRARFEALGFGWKAAETPEK